MSLKRIMEQYTPAEMVPVPADELSTPEDEHGLSMIEAEFITRSHVLCGTMTSPERRLSDLLNGSMPSVEGRFFRRSATGGTHAPSMESAPGEVRKSAILFAIPRFEPARPRGTSNPEWKPLTAYRCRMTLEQREVEGLVHLDPALQPLVALRSSNKSFLPVTHATVTSFTDGLNAYEAVIVNREVVELLQLLP